MLRSLLFSLSLLGGGGVSLSADPAPAASAPIPVLMQLDWIFNAQFAGLYQAIEQGYYAEAGLEVELRRSDPTQLTVDQVLAEPGLALGSAESNVLLSAHAAGAPIVCLATMFQDSPMGWMSLRETGIERFEDLAGKRIGVHPDGEKVLRLAAEGRAVSLDDFVLPHVGHALDPLLAGEIDAMQSYVLDEFVKLQLVTDGGGSILLAKDHGYLAYSQVFFTSVADRENYGEAIRAFLAASQRGWAFALEHPEATVDLILEKYNPALDRRYQLASLAEIAKLVRSPDGRIFAPMDPTVWARSQELFLKHGLLTQETDLDALLDLSLNP